MWLHIWGRSGVQTCLFQKPASQTLPRAAFCRHCGIFGIALCRTRSWTPWFLWVSSSSGEPGLWGSSATHSDHAASVGLVWLLALIGTSLGTKLQIHTLEISHFAKDGGTLRDLPRFVPQDNWASSCLGTWIQHPGCLGLYELGVFCVFSFLWNVFIFPFVH